MAVDALVTHGWSRISYNIVRSLSRRGLTVALGTDHFSGMARFSRFTKARFSHPSFAADPDGFIEALEEAIERLQPRVFLPSEEEIFIVARHSRRLERLGVRIPVDRQETLDLLNDKNRVLQRACTLGIPVPRTISPAKIEDVLEFGERVGYPLVLKLQGRSGAVGVSYLRSPAAAEADCLESLRRHAARFADFVVQEYVEGTGWGVSMLCRDGEVIRLFTHRRLRERVHTGGPSTIRESARNEVIEDHARRLVEDVGFSGVAMVEFKEDVASGRNWLLEVNPRFWGSLRLAIASGIDFPYLLYRQALGERLPADPGYQTGVTAKWIAGDLYSRWDHRRAGVPFNGARTANCYDDFFWDDPLPFFAQFFLYGRKRLFRGS